jgi:hypothetical protein
MSSAAGRPGNDFEQFGGGGGLGSHAGSANALFHHVIEELDRA